MPTLATNKDARFSYTILEELEAGIVLSGPEVKAAKRGDVNMSGSYATIRSGGLWLVNCHIGPYRPAAGANPADPRQDRKLLVKKFELAGLVGKIQSAGLTLIPLSFYTRAGLIKVGMGLGRGKKKADKRATIRKRETDRTIRRALRRSSTK
ncbi:MAG: SsrA-binding protein SmpB [Candidatus Kerfeldbacteria bacterium]|nr:SsrA-binding protein SmpB [Candidatus Kerfeldbacteria bacterium]